VLNKSTGTVALCALFGLASPVLVAPSGASAAPVGIGPFAPGSIVVSQGGTIAGWGKSGKGTTVEANGEVNVYPPGSNGDVAPEASFTKDMYGPFTVIFDPSGDLWADNVNTSTLVEITRAQLATPNPAPAVTISSANFYDMAFDSQGDLWAASNKSGGVYEYVKSQLTSSGSPAPHASFSGLPSLAGGIGLDPSGDLWVTTQVSKTCPHGCLVEFSKAELAMASPKPTVTISSTGGTDPVFTPSGNLWMVTGGGPKDDCFGTPCTNELVEFTKAQLATSGSPTPAVTISSTKVGAAGSLWGPYGLAFTSSGDVWVSNFNKPTAVEFGRGQLAKSGSPTPVRTIVGPKTGMNWPSYVVTVP
jgi:streptogramin lyase